MYSHVMAKSVQVLTLRLESQFVDAIREHAGPRGMTGYIAALVAKDMGWERPGNPSVQVHVTAEQVREVAARRGPVPVEATGGTGSMPQHGFVPQKNSAFRCSICGYAQAAHAKEA